MDFAVPRHRATEGTSYLPEPGATTFALSDLSPGTSGRITGLADDGVGGAVPGQARSGAGGTGLAGMAQRLATVGGSLEVDSPPGGGTRLVLEAPALPPWAE